MPIVNNYWTVVELSELGLPPRVAVRDPRAHTDNGICTVLRAAATESRDGAFALVKPVGAGGLGIQLVGLVVREWIARAPRASSSFRLRTKKGLRITETENRLVSIVLVRKGQRNRGRSTVGGGQCVRRGRVRSGVRPHGPAETEGSRALVVRG